MPILPPTSQLGEAYLAPARAHPASWRLLLGLVLFALAFAALLLLGAVVIVGGETLGLWRQNALEAVFAGHYTALPGLAELAALSIFILAWFALWPTLRLAHRRGLGSVIGRPALFLRDFLTGAILLVIVGGGISALVLGVTSLVLAPNLALDSWLRILPLALILLLIQTGAEEAVFRGWLLQEFAVRFGKGVALVLPSIVFGLLHFGNAETPLDNWLMVAATGLVGYTLADLTLRSGSLGLAWGIHFANNVIAILIASMTPVLGGLALYRYPEVDPELRMAALLADMAITIVIWMVARLWLRRR